jgi:hypothetical protein
MIPEAKLIFISAKKWADEFYKIKSLKKFSN